jgi:hypothetical protein
MKEASWGSAWASFLNRWLIAAEDLAMIDNADVLQLGPPTIDRGRNLVIGYQPDGADPRRVIADRAQTEADPSLSEKRRSERASRSGSASPPGSARYCLRLARCFRSRPSTQAITTSMASSAQTTLEPLVTGHNSSRYVTLSGKIWSITNYEVAPGQLLVAR